MIPPITSAMTRGWRILERGQCSRWQTMMIRLACVHRQPSPEPWSMEEMRVWRLYLDDEECNRILGVVNRRVGAFDHTALRSYPAPGGSGGRTAAEVAVPESVWIMVGVDIAGQQPRKRGRRGLIEYGWVYRRSTRA